MLAHVKWFTSENPEAVDPLSSIEWVGAMLLIALGVGAISWLDGWLRKSHTRSFLNKKTKPARHYVPFIVRVSTAGLLIVNLAFGYLLAPNVESTDSTLSGLIMALFAVSAVIIALGVYLRIGVALFASAYLLVFFEADFVDVLDHLEYLAIAGYLWFRGPGRLSLESLMSRKKLRVPKNAEWSLEIYRIGLGLGLITLGLSEKLLNLPVATDFLSIYDWNFLSLVGVSDRLFILIAGSVEVLVGLGLVLNKAPRVLITVVLLLMTITAIMLGIEEIYGHLFAVGAVAIFWVNDRKPLKTD